MIDGLMIDGLMIDGLMIDGLMIDGLMIDGLVVTTARNALAAPLQIICVMSEVQPHFILTAHVLPSLVPAVVGR
jgi:hypothetical protein